MKKTITFLMSLLLTGMVYADGLKPLSLLPDGYKPLSPNSIQYAPDPNSGKVVKAFNFYGGLGNVNGSNFGFSLGLDMEFPVIDPNLTIGPQFGLGVHQYGFGYYDANLFYHEGSAQLSFSGGVIVRYYADWLIPNFPEEFDVFIMSNAGFGLVTYTSYYSNATYLDWGIYVGGRWNFKENMSLYAHVGEGSTNVAVGLSFKM